MPRRYRVIPAALALAVVAALCQETVFKVDVRLVRILATVKNPAGDLVGSLEKTDFQVFDNGVPQTISVFERRTEQPLSIALLVDTSLSTGIELKYEIESVKRFLRALFKEGNPGDRLALYSFSHETVQEVGYTRRAESVENALRGLKPSGGTSLYDAIHFASQSLDDREGRHVIVVVTDGGDTTSGNTFHQALEAAQRADAVIYSILVMPIKNDAGRNIGGENALTTMGQRTGGHVFAPEPDGLDQAFLEILRDLRTQYLIGFYPKDVPKSQDPFHRLEVRMPGRADLRVVARSGYYEESETGGATGWRRVR